MATLPMTDLHDAPYSVAVVDDDPKLRTRLAMQLGEAARAAAYASLGAVEQRTKGPVVLVVGPSYTSPAGIADVAHAIRSRTDIGAVMVVSELSTEVLQHAIRAGVSDVLALPADPSQLVAAVRRAGENLQLVPHAAALAAVPGVDDSERGRTITVFSPKGGAGTSFVATNLAAVLARGSDRPVALVDADLQFGDAAVMLGLVPEHTVIDAVNQIDRLDVSMLRSLLVRHEPSGVLVLPAPIEPAFADSVSLVHLQRIIEVLASFCSHVVIDTPARFDDVVLGLLESTDDVVVVAGMDIPHIKNTKIAMQTMRLLHIPATKITLAINRANSKVKLDVAAVERTLQTKADCLLPSDIAVPQSINKSVPIVLDAPRSGVARSLERLAARFPKHARQSQAEQG